MDEFTAGKLYGLAQASAWDEVDELIEDIDPEFWLANEQITDIQKVEDFIHDRGIEVFKQQA